MTAIFDKPDVVDATLLNQVRRDFFDRNPVSIDVSLEGYRIDDENNYVLGCRAGPGLSVGNLFHEMGHLAEREIAKLLERSHIAWGYYLGREWQIGTHSGFEPDNDKSVHREKRIWAYQLSLQNHYGLNDAEDGEDLAFDLVSSVVYLPAWCIYKHRVLSDEERESLGYTQSDKQAINILAEEVRRLSALDFTYERFCSAWQERMKVLR